MAKFNEVQKQRRTINAEKKKMKIHGDPTTGKLKVKDQPHSGKRKRKHFKIKSREQKEAMDKGLVSMEDVQMAVAEAGETKDRGRGSSGKIHLKKILGLKVKQLKRKGKGKKNKRKSSVHATDSSADAMVE